jgi:EAL domain-containing protein (putative c-di-GMP-specific phosphodiesterase class I)/CHASE2 domain-containing sensor protein
MTAAIGKLRTLKKGAVRGFFRRRKAVSGDGAPKDKRLRILVWAVLISLLCGYVEAGQPFEELIKGGRDFVRARDSDGQTVVVAFDDKTVQAMRGRYFPRRYTAQTVDRLFQMGAKRVFFDHLFQDLTTEIDDKALVAAFNRHKGKVFIGEVVNSSPRDSEKLVPSRPHRIFAESATVVFASVKSSPIYSRFPYSDAGARNGRLSMSNTIAGGTRSGDGYHRPDWSIRVSSIPTYSFVDALNGQIASNAFSGKDVVIGATADVYNDNHMVVFQGHVPGLYGHVIAGETFKRGAPIDLGWIPALGLALLAAIILLFARQRRTAKAALYGSVLAFFAIPLVLDEFLITIDIVPAILAFTIIAYRGLSARRVLEGAQTNAVSGLPNLVALRGDGATKSSTLIALQIRNYAAIAASFEENVEQAIVAELRRRIDFGSANNEIYHADDTLFWFTDLEMGSALTNHLEGLNAIANTALLIGSRTVDLQLAFGIDGDFERPLSSRVGSASLCAQEAARKNDIWKFYDPKRRHEAAWQLSLVGEMEQAIANAELWVAYQPKLDLKCDRLMGAEALARWTHPIRGIIQPDEFIIAAETHNRIDKLTAFVLDQALGDATMFRKIEPGFAVSVNISAQLLEMPHLLDMVATALRKHDFPPENLVLEITETAHLARNKRAIRMMQDIRDMGMRLSVDDYGTGNATMDYLKLVPSDEVKIDKIFVADIDTNQEDRIMVQSTIELVHALGRKVVAEGVETLAAKQQLMALGCDMIQGYLVGKPMAAEDLAKNLAVAPQMVSGRTSLAGW